MALARRVAASVVAVLAWRPLSASAPRHAAGTTSARFGADAWRLVVCYAAFGFGYIVPATYPAGRRRSESLDDPAQIGLDVARVRSRCGGVDGRRIACCPRARYHGALWAAATSSWRSACRAVVRPGGRRCCWSARCASAARSWSSPWRAAGGASRRWRDATRLMAAMTSAFAVGQLAGPLLVVGLAGRPRALTVAACGAAAMLLGRRAPSRARHHRIKSIGEIA